MTQYFREVMVFMWYQVLCSGVRLCSFLAMRVFASKTLTLCLGSSSTRHVSFASLLLVLPEPRKLLHPSLRTGVRESLIFLLAVSDYAPHS